MVSVIMSVYNERVKWLTESIESILNQTYKEIEFIIVLDNPNNLVLKNLILDYCKKDGRIKFLENKENIGLVKSLNKALAEVTGDYIVRMDADDVSVNTRIQKQIEFLQENSDIDFLGSNIEFIDENGKQMPNKTFVLQDHKLIKKELKYGNAFNHPTWIFKKEILDKIKNYNYIEYIEDYEFACRVILNGYKCSNLNEKLVKYRIRSNGVCKSNELIQHRKQYELRKSYRNALKSKELVLANVENVKCTENELITFNKFNKCIEEYTQKKNFKLLPKIAYMSLFYKDCRIRVNTKIRKIVMEILNN